MAQGLPKRNLQRFKNNRKHTYPKNTPDHGLTHTEFIHLVEPFYELLKEKNLTQFKNQPETTLVPLKNEVYTRFGDYLTQRLLGSFIFQRNIEVPDFHFEKPLELKKNAKTLGLQTSYYQENQILESYRNEDSARTIKEYQIRVGKNNARRQKIMDIISKRAKLSGYFVALDMLNAKIEEAQKRRISKKKHKKSEFEDEIVMEYLERIDEFFELFGPPEQFSSDEMCHSDIIDDASTDEMQAEMQFFT